MLRCHTPALVEQVRTTRGWIDGDTICTETTFDAALLAAGAAIEAVRREGFALARPPGHHAEPGARDGLLPLRLDRDRRALGAGRARLRAGGDRRLGRPPRERDAGHRRRRPDDLLRRRCTSGRSTRAPAARTSRARRSSTCRSPPAPATTGYLEAFETVERAVAAFEPELLLVSAGFDAHEDDPLADMRALDRRLHRARARAPRARAARRRRARGRLQPRDAARPRRAPPSTGSAATPVATRASARANARRMSRASAAEGRDATV